MGNYRMKTKTLIILILSISIVQATYGQRIWGDDGELIFCKEENADSLLGKKVKIWSNGGIYTGINKSKKLNWQSKEIKKKSGENAWGDFYPESGDTGTIVHVFEYDKKRVVSARLIYLIEIRGNYVPIGCGYLTSMNNMDQVEESRHWRVQDSLRHIRYAKGCEFKTQISDCFNRAGSYQPIDTLPEMFICDLKASGVDTLMLCKYIYDNGSSSHEKAFVLWIDNGQGFIKGYYNNETHNPTESKIEKFESQQLISQFFKLDINQIQTKPSSNIRMSHSMGYCMQVMVPGLFYCERIPDYLIESDSTHPKSIWWKLVENSINENSP
jgi:hypothetical protein